MSIFFAAVALSGCRQFAPASGEPALEKEHAEGEGTEEAALPESVRLTSAAIAEAGILTWKVQPVDLEHLVVITGNVGYDENRLLHVASTVEGRVASIPVDLGSRVQKGAPLLWIESAELGHARESFLRALAELRVASRSWERAKSLLAAKAISAGEFQSREGDYLAKKAAAEGAERELHLLGMTKEELARLGAQLDSDEAAHSIDEVPRVAVRAPFAGRVVDRKVTPGTLVEALQPLATVADLSRVWVFLQAFERDLALVHEGLSVTIRCEAYPQESFAGRIDFIGGAVDETTRTVRVRAAVENRGEKLRPGMFVKAHVEVPRPPNESAGIVAVPQSALQTLEGRTQVFVEVERGVFVRRPVETGHMFEGFTEVLRGVKTGELVVTEGSFVLKSEFAKASLAEEE